jgi:hypothetical protein
MTTLVRHGDLERTVKTAILATDKREAQEYHSSFTVNPRIAAIS